ncbi:MAG TPA: transglutaminase [Clostridiales bacterium]|nr:transglutaminase [Clostridiales bacterium]
MKKLLIITSILVIAITILTTKALAEEIISTSIDQENGIVTVKYSEEISASMKVIIEKDGSKYMYDMMKIEERYPLQLGNGNYSLKIFQAVFGTNYTKVYETSLELKMVITEKVFLTSNKIINWKVEDKVVIVASELTKGMTTEKEKVNAIYKYVVENYKYDYNKIETLSTNYIPDVNKVEAEKKGICYDYSVILASMLRSQGIESKVIKGYSTLTGDTYHAWNQIYLEDEKRWITVDATADSIYKQNNMKYSMEKAQKEYTQIKEF